MTMVLAYMFLALDGLGLAHLGSFRARWSKAVALRGGPR